MVERHGGAVPDDLDALLALPGIGPYTARAVLAFAFERDVAVVDTNIARVLARRRRRAADAAARCRPSPTTLVPVGDGWAWNQVLMDLGATVCRPAPRCAECPLDAPAARGTAPVSPTPTRPIGSAGVSTPPGAVRGQRPPGPRAPCCGRSPTVPARPTSSRPASSTASSPTASSSARATSSTSPDAPIADLPVDGALAAPSGRTTTPAASAPNNSTLNGTLCSSGGNSQRWSTATANNPKK